MISKWWSKDERTLAPRLEFCSNLVKLTCCTSTSKCGTGTKSVLVLCCFGVPVPVYLVPVPKVYCMWVPVPLYVVPVPLPLQMLPLTVALPEASRQRLPSTAMIYICSLDTNPYKKCAWNSKNLHKHKNTRNNQRHLFLHKMRAKHELGLLKSDINVALLCIQHTPNLQLARP